MDEIIKKWLHRDIDLDAAKSISTRFSVPPAISSLMSLKGLSDKELINSFFYPRTDNLIDPFKMLGMKDAVSRLLRAHVNKDTVLIFGDYDVDGISSASFFYLFLTSVGFNAEVFIPNREIDGYGFSNRGIEHAAEIGSNLIVTADCGINSVNEVEYASKMGIDVIITDHHKPSYPQPEAVAILNPHQKDCNYPFKNLCGAGVVFKLATALSKTTGRGSDTLMEHSDLVSLGIGADLVELRSENRIIVTEGLMRMSNSSKPGLRELLKLNGYGDGKITIGQLIFFITPKINAAGRLSDARIAFDLLTTKSLEESKQLANSLQKMNEDRQGITEDVISEGVELVKSMRLDRNKLIVLSKDGWHEGVIGIVASRIKEIYNKPVIVISIKDGIGKGSCRSIPSYDIVDALGECSSLLSNYGGHPVAAGLTIESDNIAEFTDKVISHAGTCIDDSALSLVLRIDIEIKLDEISGRLIKFLDAMEPFGPGNHRPVFLSRDIKVVGVPRLIGKKSNIVKCTLSSGGSKFDAIGFNMPEYYKLLLSNKAVDIVYNIGRNRYRGRETTQLELKDIRISDDNRTN